jgi:DNA-binding Lrp family transcriptional regulator
MRKKINQKEEIDKTDAQLLSVLQENCQHSFRKLSSQLHISGVMASARIKNLEDKGIIRGYTAVLDPVKLGYDLTAVIFIQTEGDYLGDLEAALSQLANVIALYEITGEFDIVVVVKLKDRDSLNTLIKDLLVKPHIKKTMTNIALNVVKEDFAVQL